MGELVGINALTVKEQEQLHEAMTSFKKALQDSGSAAMLLADVIADSISANAKRVAAGAEKDRVLTRIAKARGRHLEDLEDIRGIEVVWKTDQGPG